MFLFLQELYPRTWTALSGGFGSGTLSPFALMGVVYGSGTLVQYLRNMSHHNVPITVTHPANPNNMVLQAKARVDERYRSLRHRTLYHHTLTLIPQLGLALSRALSLQSYCVKRALRAPLSLAWPLWRRSYNGTYHAGASYLNFVNAFRRQLHNVVIAGSHAVKLALLKHGVPAIFCEKDIDVFVVAHETALEDLIEAQMLYNPALAHVDHYTITSTAGELNQVSAYPMVQVR